MCPTAWISWNIERPGSTIACIMIESKLERAARMRIIAAQLRAAAAQTEWPGYRTRMLEIATDLDLEAAKLDHYRAFSIAS